MPEGTDNHEGKILTTTPQQAAVELRNGRRLTCDLDVAEQALAIAVVPLLRHVSPIAVDGKGSLARFRQLADNAGLPHDHSCFAGWLAIRAIRPAAGDAVVDRTGCVVTGGLLQAIGTSPVAGGSVLSSDRADAGAVTITPDDIGDDEVGAFATPSMTVRVPGSDVVCPIGTWSSSISAADRTAASIGRTAYDADPDAIVELDWTRPAQASIVDADSIHEDWVPEVATHPDLKPHPTRLIQSATLATVRHPEVTYRPRLPRRVIQSGLISDAQYDFIVAAGEVHSRHLPGDPENPGSRRKRVGVFLADGTGAGKTNQMLGVALDNVLHNRRKAVLVCEKRRHVKGFVEAWTALGRDPNDFIYHWETKADDVITAPKGILVTTYSMLRDAVIAKPQPGEVGPDGKKPAPRIVYVRVNQIAEWAGDDFQGAMLFDEAQAMRNAAANDEAAGKRVEISQQGLAGIALQEALPDARVVYASATGATDVHNLGYCVRLGLWGEGTAFKDRAEFVSTFERGGIPDLEQVALSLKASGVYIARSLSFEGVEVRHLPITLTDDERGIYNQAAEMWKTLFDQFQQNARMCNVPLGNRELIGDMRKKGLKGAIPYSNLTGIYESNRKASMSTLIAAFKARGVIADMHERIEEGYSVVLQMQNTYEAQLNRALDRLEGAEDVRLEPAELVSFAEMLPVEVYDIVKEPSFDDKGRPAGTINVYVPKLNEDGTPVINHHAVMMRDHMVAEAKRIRLPLPPLDQVMLAFGPARMAEVTGRSRRLVPERADGAASGSSGVLVEERKEKDRMDDLDAFHAGEKTGLIFSTGAGGSSLGYHAKIGTKAANRRRYHYLIQLGHRADEVTQGIGRTHRSDQTMPPVTTLVTVDLPADRLYASRIVSALFKLGALTQGNRHATSNGMFDERDCMDGPYAEKAWDDLQEAIQEGLIPDYDWDRFMADMGLNSNGEEEYDVFGKTKMRGILTNTNRLINRVAALTDRRQHIIFDKLREFIDKRIEAAIADGSFNAGPEILKATSLSILTDRRVPTDRIHGGSTRMLRLRRTNDVTTTSFGDAYKQYAKARATGRSPCFFKHRASGAVCLALRGKPIVTALGDKIPTVDIVTPTGTTNRPQRFFDREPWLPFSSLDEKLEGIWNAEVENSPSQTTSYLTIVADALLPVWPLFSGASIGRRSVYRMQTDDGHAIVGRPISASSYPAFCSKIESTARPDKTELDEIVGQLRTGASVAICGDGKTPHMLSGDFTGGRMTGVSIDIEGAISPTLAVVLDALPGAGTNRRTGTRCDIASRPRDIEHAVASVLAAAPALYVEQATVAAVKPSARPQSPAAAVTQAFAC